MPSGPTERLKANVRLLIFLVAHWQWRMSVLQWGKKLRALAPTALQHIVKSKTAPQLPKENPPDHIQNSWNTPAHEKARNNHGQVIRPRALKSYEIFLLHAHEGRKYQNSQASRFGKARFARWLAATMRLFVLSCGMATPGAYGAWKKSLKGSFGIWIHIEWFGSETSESWIRSSIVRLWKESRALEIVRKFQHRANPSL